MEKIVLEPDGLVKANEPEILVPPTPPPPPRLCARRPVERSPNVLTVPITSSPTEPALPPAPPKPPTPSATAAPDWPVKLTAPATLVPPVPPPPPTDCAMTAMLSSPMVVMLSEVFVTRTLLVTLPPLPPPPPNPPRPSDAAPPFC